MRITPVPCLSDNYAYILVDEKTEAAAIVDASEAAPVIAAVLREGIKPHAIWSTHHHPDHVGGNEEVASRFGIKEIYGHSSDSGRIPGQNKLLATGDSFPLGALEVTAIHIPGHTLGAIAYFVTDGADDNVVFTGDTLFAAGCGRIFEGTAAQMNASLQSLVGLGAKTKIYCGHEYTASNLKFAAHVEPSNEYVAMAAKRVKSARDKNLPSIPTTLEDELQTNPFLRVRSKEIREKLAIPANASDAEAFGAIRKAKDNFR